jgi:AcrR family transcriptional regulator
MSPRHIDQAALDARENEILDSALELMSVHGIIALTMDKLVARVNYSKGTVYNHFSSKEDVFAALCNRNMIGVSALFVRASAVSGSARERMSAIGFAYMLSVLMSPQHFALVMNAKTEMFEKASEKRRDQHKLIDAQLFGVICHIIKDAISDGELVLKENVDVQQVSFSLWAMCFGTIGLLLDGEKVCSTATGMMLENRVIAHGNIVMDGLGWAESHRNDSDLLESLKTEAFSDEVSLLRRQGVYLL